MKLSLFGKKLGMTRVFKKDGTAVAVTVIELDQSVVTHVKTKEKDGYSALQLGYGAVKDKKVKKAQKGFFDKQKIGYKKTLYEVRFAEDVDSVQSGDELGIDNFEAGDIVDITGISIGKGFQGVMKRHNFSGGRASHGDKTGRRPGSIGQSAYPARTFKNMKGPGQMGNEQVTIQNLEIINVDTENNLLIVEGSVPGAKNNSVRVSLSLKKGADRDLKVTKANDEKETTAPQDVPVDENATPEEAPAETSEKTSEETAAETVESSDDKPKQEEK